MSKEPSFNFFPSDFLTGTMLMSNEQVGKYIRLLCLQHQQGHLSEEDMLMICGEYDKKIFSKFKQDEQGNYYNDRLDEEKDKRKKFVESRRNNLSKKGENPHIDTHMDTHMESQVAKHKVAHMEYEYEYEIENNIDNEIDNNIITMFNEFWSIYPKKLKKQEAYRAFCKVNPNNDLFQKIIMSVKKCRRWRGWNDKKYIPYPATWLNNKRWEDDIDEHDCSSFDIDEAFEMALKRSYGK